MDEVKALEDIDIDHYYYVSMTIWLINVKFFFSTEEGCQLTLKRWKKAGILGLFDGTVTLPPNNSFEDLTSWTDGVQ